MPSPTPYAPLVMAVAVIAGLIVWLVGKRRRGATVAAMLVVAWGVVIAATLTPSPYAAFDPQVTCKFAFTLGEVPKERLANVLLFVPLGLVSWFATSRWFWVGLAVVAPFLIESAQGLIVAMNRGCDVMDVAANVLGVAVGVGLAVVARRLWKPTPAQ
ncbi:MAG: VanZ family protein [Actinomycetes bacterium]